jgi:methylated-DNA-[protein]-cysteine S-methyltransferase
MTVRTTFTSPLGDLLLVGEETGDGISLTSLSMPGQRHAAVEGRRDAEPFADVVRQRCPRWSDRRRRRPSCRRGPP